MIAFIALLSLAFISTIITTPVCTSDIRLAGARQVPISYNAQPSTAAVTEFAKVPWGPACTILISANGAPGLPVAVDGNTSYLFAVASRQLFSKVTGEYTDFGNGTTVIATDVTLGVLGLVPIPITFSANVYLFYDENCQIKLIEAYATIPTYVLGLLVMPPILK